MLDEIMPNSQICRLFYLFGHIINLDKLCKIFKNESVTIESLMPLWMPVLVAEKNHPKNVDEIEAFGNAGRLLARFLKKSTAEEYFKDYLTKYRMPFDCEKPAIVSLTKNKSSCKLNSPPIEQETQAVAGTLKTERLSQLN